MAEIALAVVVAAAIGISVGLLGAWIRTRWGF